MISFFVQPHQQPGTRQTNAVPSLASGLPINNKYQTDSFLTVRFLHILVANKDEV